MTQDAITADEEAAYWYARLRSDFVRRRDLRRFNEWLARDPANSEAYEEYKEFWESLELFAGDEPIIHMRREALAAVPGPKERRGPHLGALAASLAILLASAFLLFSFDTFHGRGGVDSNAAADAAASIYRTEVGQRATVTLADGSVVDLNADSLVEVRYAEARRDVRLLRGQALFRVAKDSARPFIVEAADQRITALGTEFDVRIRDGEVRVTLIEGRVAVERDVQHQARTQRSVQVRELEPGQQLISQAHEPFRIAPVNVEQAVSWSTGRLIFDDEPLGDVVEEINRYSSRKILLEDSSLARLRVSGVFQAGSLHGFVTALDAAFPVASRADEDRNAYVLSWD